MSYAINRAGLAIVIRLVLWEGVRRTPSHKLHFIDNSLETAIEAGITDIATGFC